MLLTCLGQSIYDSRFRVFTYLHIYLFIYLSSKLNFPYQKNVKNTGSTKYEKTNFLGKKMLQQNIIKNLKGNPFHSLAYFLFLLYRVFSLNDTTHP